MGMNETPSGERTWIGFFGKRNVGKSSLVNAVTGQDLSVVSKVEGTTTDPVKKAMELLPLGPVVIVDTPGIDDVGTLGELRVKKTRQILASTDLAVLVIDAQTGMEQCDEELIALFQEKEIPYVIAVNKSDLDTRPNLSGIRDEHIPVLSVSAKEQTGIEQLKETIAKLTSATSDSPDIVKDLLCEGDFVVLVVPVDSAAPKGRLILPQQQAIREVLDAGAVAIVVKETELEAALQQLGKKPRMVITDSQAIELVAKITPKDVTLTTFSILMARHKGFLQTAVQGVYAIETLQDGDCVLISEGCTHHRQCGDIGTVKLPAWIRQHTKKEIRFETSSGNGFPEDLSKYRLIIHCGGCMLNEREIKYRMQRAKEMGVPFTNYGTVISYMKGSFERCLRFDPTLLLPDQRDTADAE